MIVLDTNVTSELMRTVPAPAVVDWLRGQPVDELFTTAITVAEIRYGIARLPQVERRNLLGSAADEVFWTFADQILAFDAAAAASYAGIVSQRDRAGSPISGFDAQIAAICLIHGARLATRNVMDFQDTGIDIIDPWQTLE